MGNPRIAWHGDSLAVAGDIGGLTVWNTADGTALWRAYLTSDGMAASLSPTGELLSGTPAELDRHLVYVVEQPNGRLELVPPTQWTRRVEAARKSLPADRGLPKP